jgi:hypothetical protein
MICGTASGTKPASSDEAEKLATKAEIMKALAASFAACDQAFATITPANAHERIDTRASCGGTRGGTRGGI